MLLVGNSVFIAIYVVSIGRGESSWLLRLLFDLDGEATIPAWYSSAQLLLTGALFLHAAGAGRNERAIASWFLLVLGAGFCFLSADEAARIHENVTVVLHRFEMLPRFSGNHGIWIPIYVGIGLAFIAGTGKHWLAMRRASRPGTVWLVGGALLFLAGAVGLEILSYGDLRAVENRRLYTTLVAAEEGFEMFGASGMLIGAAILTSTLAAAAPGGRTTLERAEGDR